jgi:hypothetical protein
MSKNITAELMGRDAARYEPIEPFYTKNFSLLNRN